MLNIVLQCCGLAMLLVLFCIFVSERALDLHSKRLYFYAMISDIICVSLDILSIFGIAGAYSGQIPRWLALLICKLYVASLIFQAYEGFLYASNEFFIAGSHRKLLWGNRIACGAGVLAALILPIDFYIPLVRPRLSPIFLPFFLLSARF